MPAFKKTAASLGVIMLSLPVLASGTFASPRNYDDGGRYYRSHDDGRRASDDFYHRSGDRRGNKRDYYTNQYGDLDTVDDKRSMRYEEDSEVVKGKIIGIQENEFTVRTRDGERMQIQVSEDTNMVCRSKSQSASTGSDASGSSSTMSPTKGKDSSSSAMSSKKQSQRAGFQFGDCNFQTGDRIKARIDHRGNAQFVRYMKRREGSSQSMSRSGSGRDFGRSTQYTVLPAGALGSLNPKTYEDAFPVKTKEGEQVGNVTKVLNDSEGNPAYAIIKKKEGQMISVPWEALDTSSDGKTATLDVSDKQIAGLPMLKEDESALAHVRKNWDLDEDDEEMSTRERFYSPQDRLANKDRERKRIRTQSRNSKRYYSRPYLRGDGVLGRY